MFLKKLQKDKYSWSADLLNHLGSLDQKKYLFTKEWGSAENYLFYFLLSLIHLNHNLLSLVNLNHNVVTLLPPCWCASSLCILEHTHNLRSKWTRAENTIMMMAIMVAMMMPMMMAMMIAMMMLMMIRTHLDGVPLVANPGVSLIGGELGHHVSV